MRIYRKSNKVQFENMIYIADGPSDVPVFSLLQQYGGKTFAIYPKGDIQAFRQVDALRKDGRIDTYAEADYSEGTTAYMWLIQNTLDIAERIYNANTEELKKRVGGTPKHIIK